MAAGLTLVQLFDPDNRREPLVARDGWLESASGRRYPVINGIARFVGEMTAGQQQTAESFGFKWTRDSHWGFEPEHHQIVWDFWRDAFGWTGPEDLKALVAGRSVLDAGAGSGASLKQFIDWPSLVVAADISTAIDSCRQHFGDRSHVVFLQADLTALPLAERSFDVVWCNGVLHHTPSVLESMRAVLRHLKPGGLFVFYIYVKKAPIREFVDDFLRDRVSALSPGDAWQRMAAVTALGRSLSRITTPLTIEEDVAELGISKGTYDLQRFFYYHVLKCYWNDGMSFEDNVHVNFDWYHPRYAHRHDPAEVRDWLRELGLTERSFRVSDSGIGVVAQKGEA